MVRVGSIAIKTAAELGFLICLAGGAQLQPYRLVVVDGQSMMPTYENRTMLMATRQVGKLHRGQVVVLKTSFGTLVKRIAFLPGDSFIQIKTGNTWIDVVDIKPGRRFASQFKSRRFVVPEGQAYVLGDNSTRSVDSKTFGTVAIKDIWGTILDQREKVIDPLGLDLPLALQERRMWIQAHPTRQL